MIALRDHPALEAKRDPFAPMADEHKLAVHLRHLLHLDRTAVYQMHGGSTIVYYVTPYSEPLPPGSSYRIVLASDGKMLRMSTVGIDPRKGGRQWSN